MNENPEGTPNPLNPNPGVELPPETPVAQPEQIAPQEPIASPEPVPQMVPPQPPNNRPLTMDTVVAESVISESVSEPLEPMQPVQPATVEMPVAKDSIVEPAKKPKKKGAFIFAVILSLAAIGCAVAAILMVTVFNKKQDAVPAAIAKLMSGDIPQYVNMNGTIKVESDSSFVNSLEVTFGSNIDNANQENAANATIVANFANGSDFTFTADEVHTKDGDLYMKLSGVSDALTNYANNGLSVTDNCLYSGEYDASDDEEEVYMNCVSTEQITTSESSEDLISVLSSIGLFEVIDDEWIRIPSSDFSNISDLSGMGTTAQCLIDAAGNLGEYGSNFASMYEANPFIEYSTENLKIAKKKNDLYRLSINSGKFANFINSMTNSGFMNEMLACTGGFATNVSVDGDELAEIVSVLPQIYAEIDEDNNFTRVYLNGNSNEVGANITADLSFSYPTAAVVVEALEEYLDYTDVLNIVFSQFYGVDITDYETTPEYEAEIAE